MDSWVQIGRDGVAARVWAEVLDPATGDGWRRVTLEPGDTLDFDAVKSILRLNGVEVTYPWRVIDDSGRIHRSGPFSFRLMQPLNHLPALDGMIAADIVKALLDA